MTDLEALVRQVPVIQRTRSASPMRLWVSAVAIVYSLLVVFGVTTSSIGMPTLLETPATEAPGLVAGAPDPIRTDEYLRGTPWSLGTMEAGNQGFGSPLSYPDTALIATKTGGLATSVLFADTTIQLWVGRALPEQAFAAVWWLPVLMVALAMPLWFRALGVDLSVSAPIAVMVILSPVSVWWSWGPMTMLGLSLVCGASALAAAARLRAGRLGWQGAGLVVLASFALARLGLSYLPWAIPLGALVLVPTLVAILGRPARRLQAVTLVGSVAAVGLALFGAFLLEHRESASVIAETVYPGSRRFAGSLVSPAVLLAAPHLWVLDQNPPLVDTNQSEIASGYTVLAVAALFLVPSIAWSRARDLRLVATASAIVLAALGSWCLVDWPDTASVLFPANLVAPDRMAQVLGIAAAVTFGFLFMAWRRSLPRSRIAAVATVGMACFFLTAIGGSSFRQLNLPEYRSIWVILVALLTAALVALAVALADRSWALFPVAAGAMVATILVNPIQVGFADLRGSDPADVVRALTEGADPGARWVTDDIYADALLMATASPALSGQQWVGPDETMWRVLDPTGSYQNEWNRGAAYVTFTWADPGAKPKVSLPAGDFIVVSLDPCDPRLNRFDVQLVMSATELDRPCLQLATTLEFGGRSRYVYERAS